MFGPSATMTGRPTPQELERSTLAQIESVYQQSSFQFVQATSRPLPPQGFAWALNYLSEADQYFSRFIPTADYLSKCGLPRLANRLSQIRGNIKDTAGNFSTNLQNSAKVYSQNTAVISDAYNQMTSSISAATQSSIRSFDNTNQQFINFMES